MAKKRNTSALSAAANSEADFLRRVSPGPEGFKAIWLSVRVKPLPDGYDDLSEAVDAVSKFAVASGLPKPSALIGSVDHLYAYWASKEGLALEQWEPLAQALEAAARQHGLPCDDGVDRTQAVCVPGITDFMTTPRRAWLLSGAGKDYEFSTELAKLPQLTITASATNGLFQLSAKIVQPEPDQWPNWPAPLAFHDVSINEAIARVNAAGYFVLTLNGDIYKIQPDGSVIVQKRDGFANVFASRYARTSEDKLISAGVAWRKSRTRREYDSIGYWPDDHGRPPKSYNLWQHWGIEPKRGDWSIINNHNLNVIARGDNDKAKYILDWCAHMVQRPWEKPGVALVLRGRKGTGKTLLTRILANTIGWPNTLITASGKKLFAQFNWQLADKLLIGAEEAFFAGNRELNDQLKHLITGEEIELEQKYGQRLSMKSLHRVIMTSNHDQVIAASDDERRYFVCDVSDKRRGDDPYFDPLVRVIRGEDKTTLAAFMHELQTRDIKDWKPEQAARKSPNSDLARQKLLSLEPPLQWLLEQTLSEMTGAPSVTTNAACDIAAAVALQQLNTERIVEIASRSIPLSQGIGDIASVAPPQSVDYGKVADIETAPPIAPDNAGDKKWPRDEMLRMYRDWVKTTQVRGASDFNGAEMFWASVRRLLNSEIFPGRRLFVSSGGERFVLLPSRKEMLDGFNRLLGASVIEVDED